MPNPKSLSHEAKSLLTIISNPGKTDQDGAFCPSKRRAVRLPLLRSRNCAKPPFITPWPRRVRREMVTLTVPKTQGSRLLNNLCEHFNIGKETHGIAFLQNMDDGETDRGDYEYALIAVVVNEGVGEDVVDSARKSQPVGATILKALGTADHSKITFDFEIIPQKELVLIIARTCHVNALRQSILDGFDLDEPGHGIFFSLALDEVRGILDMVPECDGDPTEETPAPGSQNDHTALLVGVDRGHSHNIVSCSESHGGTGATILHFRREELLLTGLVRPFRRPGKRNRPDHRKKGSRTRNRGQFANPAKKSGDQEMALSKLRVTRFCRLTELG